ncbi:MAG TPA: L-histidine N(alpha)-methyltransferase [Polyangia bacterium]|jgi:dimethylhistidine N-methyltransferase|nr:L-histidine N(alpha)-methyltransferase [Polyangia bacterium]
MPLRAQEARAAIEPASDSDFAVDVRRGLSAAAKYLSCKYFYDAEGSRLFEEICELPEYYPTRAERSILDAHASDLVRRLPANTSMIELGSGSSTKTRLLIDAFLAAHGRLRYLPIDVSPTMLAESCSELARSRPTLELLPIAAEYESGLQRVRQLEAGRPKIILWLGSSIGNYAPDEAAQFLQSLRGMLSPRDRLLVGIDLRKGRDVLEPAYDDAAGVTARFNRNLLTRINRQLGGHFDVGRFAHRAVWHEKRGCVSMYLVARGKQRVRIDELGLTIAFRDGEAIHTESSYKYAPSQIDALAADAGLAVEQRWTDAQDRFSLNLLAPIHA